MNVELRLEKSWTPVESRAYSAVLVQGSQASSWLGTVCAMGLKTSQIHFLPICSEGRADSPSAGTPFAALIIGPELRSFSIAKLDAWNTSLEAESAVSDNARSLPPQAYYCLAERLYLPSDAQVSPYLTEVEIKDLLPSGSKSLYVWHPAVGLLEFETNQLLSTIDLLSSVEVSSRRWNGAARGETLNSFISMIRPEPEREDVLQIISDPSQDEATSFAKIDLAPKAPDEVSLPGLRDAASAVGMGFLAAFLGLAKLFSNSSSKTPGKQRQQSPENISAKRENALKRLLHMLEKDPDNGLKFAIPFGGNLGRGTAPPSTELDERSIDFHINQIGWSGAVDSWSMPYSYQLALSTRYRELAQRAVRLGQYRRAAYIYAKLLNDLHSAASVLENGKYYVDAAALYLNHLHKPLKAAHCFRNAGLWEDSVAIYREQKQWIDAGDIYMQLDDTDQAHEMYRKAVGELEHSKSFVAAAELAENKLGDIDEAVRLLVAGWAINHHAQQSLEKLLQLNARLSRHGHTLQLIERISNDSSLPVHKCNFALNVFSQISIDYPDNEVRSLAQTQCWALASRVLTIGSMPSSDTMESIRRLAPADLLLGQDTRRFAAGLVASVAKSSKPAQKRHNLPGRIVQVGEANSNSNENIYWHSAAMSTNALFMLGIWPDFNEEFSNRITIDARNQLKNPLSELLIQLQCAETCTSAKLIPHPTDKSSVFVQSIPGTPNWNEAANALTTLPNSYINVLPPHSDVLLSLAFQAGTETGWALRFVDESNVRLDTIRTNGLVQSSVMVKSMFQGDALDSVRMVPLSGQLSILANGSIYPIPYQHLKWNNLDLARYARPLPLTAKLNRAVASPMSAKLIVPREEGLISFTPFNGDYVLFADSLHDPFLCSTASGAYVACCRTTGRIQAFRVTNSAPTLVAEFDLQRLNLSTDDILGLYGAHWRTHFLIVTHQGKLFQLKVET